MATEALELAREAKDLAHQADARREAHERLCTERWEQLRASIRDMMQAVEERHRENRQNLGRLWWTIIAGMGITICGMAGLIVTLSLRGHVN